MLSNINGAALNTVNCLSRLLSDSALVVLGWVNTLAVVLMPSLTHPGQCFSKIWKIISVYWCSVFMLTSTTEVYLVNHGGLMQFDIKPTRLCFSTLMIACFGVATKYAHRSVCSYIQAKMVQQIWAHFSLSKISSQGSVGFHWQTLIAHYRTLAFFKDQIGIKSKAIKNGKI